MNRNIWIFLSLGACLAAGTGRETVLDLASSPITVIAASDPIQQNAVAMLISEAKERHHARWTSQREGQAASASGVQIHLLLDKSRNLGPEAYTIAVQAERVTVFAATSRGLLYGAAGLLDEMAASGLRLPAGEKTETPQSKYRGVMLEGSCNPDQPAGLEKVHAQIRYLARHRFNFVILSQWNCGLADMLRYRYFPELTRAETSHRAPALIEGIRGMIRYSREWGLDAYLGIHEISYPDGLVKKVPAVRATPPPDADRRYRPPTAGGASSLYSEFGNKPQLCISEPKTWQFVEAKTREVAELFPDAAGLHMWSMGSDSDVFFCGCERCRRLNKSERALLLIEHITHGMDQGAAGKKLLFRTYMGAWKNLLEPEVYIPLAHRLPKSLVFVNKAQYGDFYIFNSLNPLVGSFPDNDEMCEFDPGGEYHGGFFGLQPTLTRYMAGRMKTYAGRGVTSFAFRNLDFHTDFSDIDWDVGAKLAWNTNQDVETLRTAWARAHFGAEAGPLVLEFMDRSFDIMRKSLYADGINFSNWGLFIENINRTRHILVDRSAKLSDRGLERIAPTPANLSRLIAEKEEAFELASQTLAQVDRMRGKIPVRQLDGMRESLLLGRELARVYRPELEALLRYLAWESTLSEVERERMRQPVLDAVARTRIAVAEATRNLSTIDARKFCEHLGMDYEAFKANKGLYSNDPAVTSMDRNIALPYAVRLVDEIAKKMDYEPASVFGYY